MATRVYAFSRVVFFLSRFNKLTVLIPMITDEQLSKIAKDQNVKPLAHVFNVKLADARGMVEEVKQRAFVEKMAAHGFTCETNEELGHLLELGYVVEQIALKQAADQAGNSVYKLAGEHLRRSIGGDAPEAADASRRAIDNAAAKVAQYATDDNVIMHMLALAEAEAINS